MQTCAVYFPAWSARIGQCKHLYIDRKLKECTLLIDRGLSGRVSRLVCSLRTLYEDIPLLPILLPDSAAAPEPSAHLFQLQTRFAWHSFPPGLLLANCPPLPLIKLEGAAWRKLLPSVSSRFPPCILPVSPGYPPRYLPGNTPNQYCARALRALVLNYTPGLRGIVSRLVSSLHTTRQYRCATNLSAVVLNYIPGLRGIVSRLVFLLQTLHRFL